MVIVLEAYFCSVILRMQCGGSGMFIPDPNFSIPKRFRIRFRIKAFKYGIFKPKKLFLSSWNMIQDVHSGSGSWIRILNFYPSLIKLHTVSTKTRMARINVEATETRARAPSHTSEDARYSQGRVGVDRSTVS
jgi:hypothetical protein